jgi:uncharacterized protein (TIGR04222 family)
MSEGHATITVHDLTPYQVACLAGGPARAVQTAAVELIRRGTLTAAGGGVLTRPEPGGAGWPEPASAGWPGPGSADRQLEQQIVHLAWQPGGCSLRLISRRSRSWPAIRQLESRLAAGRLIFSRRHRRIALAAALAIIAVAAAAGAAFAAGWQAIPTARSPLGIAAAVIAAGLLARSRQRVTGSGRELLADTTGLSRLVLARLPAGQQGTGSGGAGRTADPTPADVVAVATGGLAAIGSRELSTRLTASPPRGLFSRASGRSDARHTASHLVL